LLIKLIKIIRFFKEAVGRRPGGSLPAMSRRDAKRR